MPFYYWKQDKKAAREIIYSLPLVKNNKIRFEIMEIRPYTGYERIINTIHI
jgi:hypothetical protein